MIIMFYIGMFVLGTVLASFINATLYRVENKYKYPEIILKNSHCESCGHQLSWIDLVPIIGFVINKGRCKYCGEKVNIYYPISELILGLAFFLSFYYTLPSYIYAILLFLFMLSYFDIKDFGIPKNLTHIFLVICVIIFLFNFNISNLYIPLILVVFLLALNLLKKSFGMGDILLIAGLGALISWQNSIVFFWMAIMISLLYSLGLIALKNIDLKKAKVPMVPFISISFLLTAIYGDTIFEYILKFFQI